MDQTTLNNALLDAVQAQNLAHCKTLLSQGAQVNYANSFGFTPLHRAVSVNHAEICRLLLDAGADPSMLSISKEAPLHKAAWMGHLESAQVLLEMRPECIHQKDGNGKTAEKHAANNPAVESFLRAFRLSLQTEEQLQEALPADQSSSAAVRSRGMLPL